VSATASSRCAPSTAEGAPITDVEHTSHKGMAPPISWLPVPEETGLPDNLRNLFRKAREKTGFVPDVFKAYSFRPERLRT
jgi:hypothetical protein